MTFGSNCSGECGACVIGMSDVQCLAGHGDDHFTPLTVEGGKRAPIECSE